MIRYLAAAAALALSGCVTPMITPHPVRFEANVPATVTFESQFGPRSCRAGETVNVPDWFGFFSVYTFTATAPGYRPAVLTFSEPTFMHAQGVVPDVVRFELVPD